METGERMDVVDEAEEIPSGESTELTVTLEAAHYLLLCNILEEEERVGNSSPISRW